MKNKRFNLGCIGVGGRGYHAYKAHIPEKNTFIIAGTDTNPEAVKAFQEKFPDAKAYKDYKALLRDKRLDAVFIMTPDFLHEEMAIAALRAGKAVYLEKPIAISIDGCDKILRTAMETGTKLFVGHNMRHFPFVLKMKEVIDSGIIGKIQAGWCRHFVNYGGAAYFRDWHSERKNTCGLLLQKGAHDIDVMHWLMGAYTKRVVGMGMLSYYITCGRRPAGEPMRADWDPSVWEYDGYSTIIDVEDQNMIMMQLANGTQACYMQCHYAPDNERNYTFIGTRGRVENHGKEVLVWTQRGDSTEPDIRYAIKNPPGSHSGADFPIIQNFLDFVRFGKKTNTSPIAARQAVATGVLGHISMRNSCVPKDIPPLSSKIVEYFENGQVK